MSSRKEKVVVLFAYIAVLAGLLFISYGIRGFTWRWFG